MTVVLREKELYINKIKMFVQFGENDYLCKEIAYISPYSNEDGAFLQENGLR